MIFVTPRITGQLKPRFLPFLISTLLFAPAAVLAQVDQDQDASEAILEEVVVTGIKASLDNAAQIKRASDSIVDAITAEDIGLFSDNNIGEALQRVPGVQLERSEGEGYRISIRGLGPRFVRTTLNGRTALSSPGGEGGSDARGFSFNVIPSEVITRATVKKSAEAKDVEGGIGGVVDLETTRPLDLAASREQDFYTAGSLRYDKNEFGDTNTYRGTIFFNKKVSDSFGFFLAAALEQSNRLQDSSESQDFQIEKFELPTGTYVNGTALTEDTDYELAIFDGMRAHRRDIERDRNTFTGGMQWQPNDNWDIYFDWTYGEEDGRSEQRRSWVRIEDALDRLDRSDTPTTIPWISINFDDADEFSEGTVLAYEFHNHTEDSARQFVDIASLLIDHDQTINVGGINAKWSEGAWSAEFDLGYASHERVTLQRRMNADLDFSPNVDPARFPLWPNRKDSSTIPLVGVNGTFDITSGVPLVFFYDPYGNPMDWNDTTDLNFDQDRQSYYVEDNEETSFRFDAARELDGWFSSLNFGMAWRDKEHFRTELRTEGNAFVGSNKSNYLDHGMGQYGVLFVNNFQDNLDDPNWTHNTYAVPSIYDWIAADPMGTFAKDPKDGLVRQDVEYTVGEEITAFYLQTSFSDDNAAWPYRGNIGIRYAMTDQSSTGYFGVQEGSGFYPIDPDNPIVTTKRDYDDWLPSANIAFDVSENWIFRFAASRTIARPDPVDLRQGWDIDKDLGEDNVGDAGNPMLEPYRTDNFDLALEWYPESGGAYALGYFYKILDGFISDGSEIVYFDFTSIDPELGMQEYEIERPVNTDGGDISGVEFAFHQPFDAFTDGFFSYFGINASFTWVDAQLDAVREGTGRFVELRGTSDFSMNIVGYYERGKFAARLAYNDRNDYLHQEAVSPKDFDEYNVGEEYVNLNLDWRFNKHWRVRFSANNLTDSQRYRVFQTAGASYFSDLRNDGRTYTLELRGNM